MSIWLELLIAWMVLGAVLNIIAMTVFHKRGYFKWLNGVHDSLAYNAGYADAKKEMEDSLSVSNSFPSDVIFHTAHEHGVHDSRYK